MIFTLEAMQADYGDCLILYCGTKTKPKVIVIDGGPKNIYANSLRPRLAKIKKKLSPSSPLPLSMVMVSHLDEDHVKGVLDLTEELVDKQTNNDKADFEIKNIWVNSFDDIIGNIQIPVIAALPASVSAVDVSTIPGLKNADPSVAAVIASTGQGRQLRDNIKTLSVAQNNPFGKMAGNKANLVRSDLKGKKSAIPWENIKITVLHPNEKRLLDLQKQWDKDLKKAKAAGDNTIIMASLTNSDTSPFNLSSIVCLVEAGGKKILLTGDARSDDVLEGLTLNKMLDAKGKMHVDILKLPHHGSIRNASPEFYKAVTADHYIISANGKFDNPDKDLLDLLGENLVKGTIHLTNQTGEKGLAAKLKKFSNELVKKKSKLKLDYRKETASSVIIELGDKIGF